MNTCIGQFSRLIFLLVVVFIHLLSWSVSQAALSFSGCGNTVVQIVNAQFEARIVELVNEERAKNNLPPMKHNPVLSNAARYHAADMAQDDYFLHDTYDIVDGAVTKQCSWVERIKTFYPSPRAENIAKGFDAPEKVMRAWLDSAGHRTNILSDYWEIGPGFSDNVWVQDFGTQADVFPLIVNREANNTDSINVALYIYGNWTQMRLRNDDGAWGDWQPFNHDVTWMLNNTPGVRTVEVELTDGNRTVSSSDSIELLTTASVPDPTPTTSPSPKQPQALLYLPLLSR